MPICFEFRRLRYPYRAERIKYNLNFARTPSKKLGKSHYGLPNSVYIYKFMFERSNKYQHQTAGRSSNWQNIDG